MLQSDKGVEHDCRVANKLIVDVRQAFHYYESRTPYDEGEEWEMVKSKNDLHLYGHSTGVGHDCPMIAETTTPENQAQGQVGQGQLSPSRREAYDELVAIAFAQRDDIRRIESIWNDRLTTALYEDPNSPEAQRGKVNFNRWQDTPPCLCCGWDLEVHRKMLIDRSPADRAELHRGVSALVNPA